MVGRDLFFFERESLDGTAESLLFGLWSLRTSSTRSSGKQNQNNVLHTTPKTTCTISNRTQTFWFRRRDLQRVVFNCFFLVRLVVVVVVVELLFDVVVLSNTLPVVV